MKKYFNFTTLLLMAVALFGVFSCQKDAPVLQEESPVSFRSVSCPHPYEYVGVMHNEILAYVLENVEASGVVLDNLSSYEADDIIFSYAVDYAAQHGYPEAANFTVSDFSPYPGQSLSASDLSSPDIIHNAPNLSDYEKALINNLLATEYDITTESGLATFTARVESFECSVMNDPGVTNRGAILGATAVARHSAAFWNSVANDPSSSFAQRHLPVLSKDRDGNSNPEEALKFNWKKFFQVLKADIQGAVTGAAAGGITGIGAGAGAIIGAGIFSAAEGL